VYILCAWVGHSAIALRAFFEHRPATNPEHRIAVVGSNRFFSMLYLANNLHAVHHKHPEIPWYRLTQAYEQSRNNVLNRNNYFFFNGYHQWLKFLFKPIHSPVHPGTPEQDP